MSKMKKKTKLKGVLNLSPLQLVALLTFVVVTFNSYLLLQMRANSNATQDINNAGGAYDSDLRIRDEHFTTATTTPSIVSANQTKRCGTNSMPKMDHSWQIQLPKAPSCFHLNSSIGKQIHNFQSRKPQCSAAEKRWNNTCCKTVFFIGSGKCGSTSLALLLKHRVINNYQTFDNTSGFADGGKEPCVGTKSNLDERNFYSKYRGCSKCKSVSGKSGRIQSDSHRTMKLTVLDACPRYRSTEQARKIACTNPDAKFVMLVRDPSVRAISDHNDRIIRGSGASIRRAKGHFLHPSDEQRLIMSASLVLSDYVLILRSFLMYFPPENILIVQSDHLKDSDSLNDVIGKIQEHFGVPRRSVSPLVANANWNDFEYTLPWKSSFEETINKLCPKTLQFYNLVQKQFDWMLSIDDPRAKSYYVQKDK